MHCCPQGCARSADRRLPDLRTPGTSRHVTQGRRRLIYSPKQLSRIMVSRPRLLSAIGVGIATDLALHALSLDIGPSTIAPLAWDAGCLWFLTLTLWNFRDRNAPYIRAKAASQDEGQGLILAVVVAASVASLAASGVELSAAKSAQGLEKALRVVVACVSVGLSWAVVQVIFALHYAHEYYAPDDDDDPSTHEQGGLKFSGDDLPDYWDFLHFAVVIGVASQTADISFTSKPLRRLGTIHSLVAFTFNTIILALTVNVAASLF